MTVALATASPGHPRLQFHPGPLSMPGLTPARRQADLASRGPLAALGAFRTLDPEDSPTLPRSAARGHGALPATGHALTTPPSRLPRCGSLPLVPTGTPGHLLPRWV